MKLITLPDKNGLHQHRTKKNTLGDEIETFARGNGAHKHQREKEMK